MIRRFFHAFIFVAVFFILWCFCLVKTPNIYAIDDCSGASISPGLSTKDNTITISSNEISSGNPYKIQISKLSPCFGCFNDYFRSESKTATKNNQFSATFEARSSFLIPGAHQVILESENRNNICQKTVNVGYENDCSWTITDNPNPYVGQNLQVNLQSINLSYFSDKRLEIKEPNGDIKTFNNFNGSLNYTPSRRGVYTFTSLFSYINRGNHEIKCSARIDVGSDAANPGKGIISGSSGPTGEVSTKNICANDPTPNKECEKCFGDGDTWTALGCIKTHDLTATISWFVRSAVFIASGIAFLLMAFGAFQIITSSGDPKKTQAGSELITSALSGLLFIILSIFLLKLIGVDILQIPGFSEKSGSFF